MINLTDEEKIARIKNSSAPVGMSKLISQATQDFLDHSNDEVHMSEEEFNNYLPLFSADKRKGLSNEEIGYISDSYARKVGRFRSLVVHMRDGKTFTVPPFTLDFRVPDNEKMAAASDKVFSGGSRQGISKEIADAQYVKAVGDQMTSPEFIDEYRKAYNKGYDALVEAERALRIARGEDIQDEDGGELVPTTEEDKEPRAGVDLSFD